MWTRGILRQAPDIVIMDVQPKKAESRAGPQKSLFAVLTKEIPHRARNQCDKRCPDYREILYLKCIWRVMVKEVPAHKGSSQKKTCDKTRENDNPDNTFLHPFSLTRYFRADRRGFYPRFCLDGGTYGSRNLYLVLIHEKAPLRLHGKPRLRVRPLLLQG